MVAHADDKADPRPNLRMRKRIGGPGHPPFLSAVIAVGKIRFIDVDDDHSRPEQLDKAQGILLSENEISVPVAGERDTLDALVPHA